MAIKAIIIDFYGTLVKDNSMLVKDICYRISQSSHRMVSPGEVGQTWWRYMTERTKESYAEKFRPIRVLERNALHHLVDEYDSFEDPEVMVEQLYESLRKPVIYADSRLFIGRLPLPVCVVANADRDDLEMAVEFTRLDIDLLACSESARAYKPREEVFDLALSYLGVKAEEALHVGDSMNYDIEPAKAMGMKTAWINRLSRTNGSSIKPDVVCPSLTDLRMLIK